MKAETLLTSIHDLVMITTFKSLFQALRAEIQGIFYKMIKQSSTELTLKGGPAAFTVYPRDMYRVLQW